MLKPWSQLSKRQQQRRTKENIHTVKTILTENNNVGRNIKWKDILKENPNYLEKEEFNPLTEDEVMEMIQDNNISDRTMINIIKTLAKKWGRKQTITPNIRSKLVDRKNILDTFFTKLLLDEESALHFKDKNNKPLKQYVVYCYDSLVYSHLK